MNKAPYANLDPHLILNAIESLNLPCSESLFALNSYENRVYQIGMHNTAPLIAKFYRPNRWSDEAILEEHQFAQELLDHDIPVVAPLVLENGKTLHHYQGFRFALFPRQGARPLDINNIDHLEWMGRFIGRIHAVGKSKPFLFRKKIDLKTDGRIASQFLIENNFIPFEIEKSYCDTLTQLLEKMALCVEQVDIFSNLRLHGDCHLGNILWSDQGPHIVDLDDCLMGPAIQDLWMMLSGDDIEESELQLNRILKGYQAFCDFNYREILLIEPLRTLRMINYAAWLAKRWDDPAFPHSFPWFNTLAYWREHLHHLQNQMVLLDKILARQT